MKINREANQNARKFKLVSQYQINWGSLFFISMLLMVISCVKSDDLEIPENESPVDINTPVDNDSDVDINIPVDNDSDDDINAPVDNYPNIIYTDIEPDFISENVGDSYRLDLNNDGIVDFSLMSFYGDNQYLKLYISSSNHYNLCITIDVWGFRTVPLNTGEEIFNLDSSSSYISYQPEGYFAIGDCFINWDDCSSYWENKIDKYLGLRFLENGRIHYGWARLNITSQTQWTIKDYAYNARPNKPILAGQKE